MKKSTEVTSKAISKMLTSGLVPTAEQMEENLKGLVNPIYFWVPFALLYGLRQESGKPLARHLYDVPMRGIAHSKFGVTPLELMVGFSHDVGEEILGKSPQIDGINKLEASFLIMDILSGILGDNATYGSYQHSQGGIITLRGVDILTNRNSLVAKPALDLSTTEDDPARYHIEKTENSELIFLTPPGREFALQHINNPSNPKPMPSEIDIGRFYNGVHLKILDFFYRVNNSRTLDLESRADGSSKNRAERDLTESEKIALQSVFGEIVEKLDSKIKSGRLLSPEDLERKVRGATDETEGIVADPAYERPADLSLVPSSGHIFKATLEKTLYHAYVAKIGKAVRNDSKYFKTSQDQSYMHPLMVKIYDATDNVSTVAQIPIAKVASIHRKARVVLREAIATLEYLNKEGMPLSHRRRLYDATTYLFGRVKGMVREYADLYKRLSKKDTIHAEDSQIFSQMESRLRELHNSLRAIAPSDRGRYWSKTPLSFI